MNILLVDDEALVRQGLRSLLEKEPFTRNVYEAEDEEGFVCELAEHRIDIVLLDIRLRKTNGLELLKKMKTFSRQPRVIAVTGLDGVELMINLLKSGVHGIIHKLDGYNKMIQAIKKVSISGTYYPEHILKIMKLNAKRWENVPVILLSDQEKDLLRAIASGGTTREIAMDLEMSPSTAETYRLRLMRKVGVQNTAALIVYAYRNGML